MGMAAQPSVSILLAARNEEAQLLNCLQALEQLDYPSGYWEVWIGNDRSTDRTGVIAEGFAQNKPYFHVLHIEEERFGKAKGKANVLAQLAHQAIGDVFLFTDADVLVPPSWIKGMLRHWYPQKGIITGFTLVQGHGALENLQGLDWTWALTLIKASSDLGIPTTAMGNNMLVSAEAYWETGGYEAIPFSLTEDYALFRAIIDRGYGFQQLIHPRIMATTKAISTFSELLQQRQRWMHGAVQVPWYLQSGLYLQLLWLPLMCLLFIYAPFWALSLWLAKILGQAGVMAYQLLRLGKPQALKYALLYEPYALITYSLMAYRYYAKKPLKWKGREFAD